MKKIDFTAIAVASIVCVVIYARTNGKVVGGNEHERGITMNDSVALATKDRQSRNLFPWFSNYFAMKWFVIGKFASPNIGKIE